jgi:hypothetical protein
VSILRGRLRNLAREAEGQMITIPQKDGPVARFPPGAGEEALVNLMDRLGAGEDAPPEHPLVAAARNSSEPEWSRSFYATNSEGWTDLIEDLSE